VDTALKLKRAWPRFEDAEFAERFWALESWNADSVDVPGAAYRRLIKELYLENRLARGEFLLRGEPVDLSRIECPLLVVSSGRDTTCPPDAANALLDLVGSKRKETLELKGGHVLPVVGPRAKATFHHQLAEWLGS
jgi:polyhydroxyalkanoate synthase